MGANDGPTTTDEPTDEPRDYQLTDRYTDRLFGELPYYRINSNLVRREKIIIF